MPIISHAVSPIEDIIQVVSFIVIVLVLSIWLTVKIALKNMLVCPLFLRIVIEYIKVISRPTMINVGQQSFLMVSAKIIALFSSFCLFTFLNKFMVMPQTLKKFHGTG